MDANKFLAEFGHIANAPGGVARLRELIIGMSVEGKLVEQYGTDEPASELLKRIQAELIQLISSKQIKRSSPLRKVTDEETKVKIPVTWKWARLGTIASKLTDGSHNPPKGSNSGYPMLSGKDILDGTINFSSPSRQLSEDDFLRENSRTDAKSGDVLLTIVGSIGRSAVVPKNSPQFALQRSVAVIRSQLCPEYLSIQLRSPRAKAYYDSHGKGTAQKGIYLTKLREMPITIPPLEEQSRIAAKVDELMALCDQLEALQQKRRTLQNHLRQATLQAVAASQSPHELQESWRRLKTNFGQLFSAPEDVGDLRQAVFDLAVSGRLSEFSESDESSAVLKGKILSAKELGVSNGSFSRKKQVKPEALEETVLPSHWETITLDEAISTIDAGWSPACLPSARTDENKWGVLKTTAVQVLRFLPNEHKELPVSLDPRPQYQTVVGDILITRAGPKNRVGVCCVVDNAPAKLMISDKLIRFHIVNDLINPNFVALCLSAGEPGRIIERLKSGMADSQMNISQDKLRSITIPLPPIEEQFRILEKVDSFMGIVNKYSEKLQKHARVAEQVAAATISTLTGIAIEQEEEPMKAPQTENEFFA